MFAFKLAPRQKPSWYQSECNFQVSWTRLRNGLLWQIPDVQGAVHGHIHVVCYHVTYDGGWRETTNYQSLHTWFIMSSVTMWHMMGDGGRRQTTKVSIHDSSCRLLPCDVWWGMAGDDKLPKSPYMIHHVVCYHVTYDGDGGRRQTTKVSIHDSSCRLLPCDVWWGMAGDDKLPKSPYMIHHVVCYHVTYDGGWQETTNYQSLHTWFIMSSVTMWRMMGDGGRRQTTKVSIHDSSCRLLPCDIWWGMAGDDKLPKSPYMIHHVVCYHVTYDGGWRETTNYQSLHTWFIMSSVTMWRMMGDGGRRQTTKVSIHDSSCRLLPCDVWWGMAGDDKLPKSPYMIHHGSRRQSTKRGVDRTNYTYTCACHCPHD